MKKLLALVAAVAAGTVFADDHLITEPGTVTFEAPTNSALRLFNAASGTVTFDESAAVKDADHAIAFAGFGAADAAESVFLGGWWNFGGTGLFANTDEASNRLTVFDGATVKDAGDVWVAGVNGSDNVLALRNAASVDATTLTLGYKKLSGQHSKVLVSGGSALTTSGAVKMTSYDGTVYDSNSIIKKYVPCAFNELVVSNANSALTVGGTLYLGHNAGNNYSGPGSNSVVITDHATATLQAISIDGARYPWGNNRFEVSKGASVTASSVSFSSTACYGWNPVSRLKTTFAVLDGATFENSGSFVIGYTSSSSFPADYELLVSNATFRTDKMDGAWFRYAKARIRISGPQAEFTVQNYSTSSSGDNLFNEKAADAEIVVENGANWSPKVVKMCYTGKNYRNKLIARTGGTLRLKGQTTGGSNYAWMLSEDNEIVAENDGIVTNTAGLTLNGLRPKLRVDNGTYCSDDGGVYVGLFKAVSGNVTGGKVDDFGSNAVLRVSGDHPVVDVQNVSFVNKTDPFFALDLPATGYAAGCATSEKPLVKARTTISVSADTTFEVNGAAELLAWHEAAGTRGKYVVMSAPTLTISDEKIAEANAALVEGVKFVKRVVDGAMELVLKVAPPSGIVLIVR